MRKDKKTIRPSAPSCKDEEGEGPKQIELLLGGERPGMKDEVRRGMQDGVKIIAHVEEGAKGLGPRHLTFTMGQQARTYCQEPKNVEGWEDAKGAPAVEPLREMEPNFSCSLMSSQVIKKPLRTKKPKTPRGPGTTGKFRSLLR